MKGFSRARVGALSALAGLVLVGMGTFGPSAQAATNDLTNWTKQGAASAGTWTVSQDKKSVVQTDNGAPTFFVSNFLKSEATFTVDITPATSSDNDYVGVVMGYTAPVGSESTTCESADCPQSYILLDWKQEAELGQQAGFHLVRVSGNHNVRDKTTQLPCHWNHTDSQSCQILAESTGTNQGWGEAVKNTLKITYGAGNIKVESVGTNATATIFDVPGVFPSGRIGFYNYSQANVTYGINDLADPTTSSSSSSSSSTTTSTTIAPTTTTGGPVTTLATRIVRTGPNDAAGWELLGGAALIAIGAALYATRGKRPDGRHFG